MFDELAILLLRESVKELAEQPPQPFCATLASLEFGECLLGRSVGGPVPPASPRPPRAPARLWQVSLSVSTTGPSALTVRYSDEVLSPSRA